MNTIPAKIGLLIFGGKIGLIRVKLTYAIGGLEKKKRSQSVHVGREVNSSYPITAGQLLSQ